MNKKLKIAFVAPFHETVPPKKYGSIERIVCNLIKYLSGQGHEITLLAAGSDKHAFPQGVTVINVLKHTIRNTIDMFNLDPETAKCNLEAIGTTHAALALQKEKFDIITCQYALFFFPNAQKALKNMKNSLKKSGNIGISVHGSKDSVPFFSSIIDSVTKYVPDYVPPGSPDLDRFGTKSALKKEVSKAGFSKITVKDYVFHFSPGKFEDYWRNYLKYIAKPLKEKLNDLDYSKRKELKQLVKDKTSQYTKQNGKILFPWQVLILGAKN